MSPEKFKSLLANIIIVSLPATALFNIIEIWTESVIAAKCKYTFFTLFLTALIMGLLMQSAERKNTEG